MSNLKGGRAAFNWQGDGKGAAGLVDNLGHMEEGGHCY
jgi:hypothetical protein